MLTVLALTSFQNLKQTFARSVFFGCAFAALSAVAATPPKLASPDASQAAAPSTSSVPSVPAVPFASSASAAPADTSLQAATGPGQRIYERARPRLLQVRTLLKTQDSQSSVGSGFLVDEAGHIVTNYHVISQFAQQPSRNRLVYVTVDGQQGALELLAFDVVHDLALLKPVDVKPLAGRGSIALRPADEPMSRGARIYSLGNPLDVGFAVAEGSYNGPAERSFLDTLFFGGSLSAGMSGGPALDDQGRLIGVNVAARRDGEQVSFLVPTAPLRVLLERGRGAKPITTPSWPEITRQLMGHEADLTARFVKLPWRAAGHPRYNIPVPQEQFMRCWGRGSPQNSRGLQFERSDCEMDSRIFVSGSLLTGFITVRHEAYDGSKLGALRFAERYSTSFNNEFVGRDDRLRTAPRCLEQQIGGSDLPLKAVVCMRAYKRLEGLHDVSILVATLDGNQAGAQGRLDAYGISLASAQRLSQHYLDGFAWTANKTAATPASR